MDNSGLEIGHDSASRSVALQTNGTDRLTIGGSGNTTIHNNLEVQGADVTVTANIKHAGDGDTYYGFHGNDLWRVVTGGVERIEVGNSGIRVNDSGVDMDFTIESNNDANMFYVDGTNDRIGIGTSSPAFKFSVDSGTSDYPGYFKSTDNKAAIVIADDDTTIYVSAESDRASLGHNPGLHVNNINVRSSGNVGIGVTAPTSKLDIRGSGDADIMSKIINTGQTTNGRKTEFLFGKDNGANLSGVLKYVYNSTQASRRIDLVHYQTTNGISILDGGNVGIGRADPGYALDVQSSNGLSLIHI